MSTAPSPIHSEPRIAALLARLRRGIRWYVGIEGLGWAVAWLGLAFWLSLAIDWTFEPPVAFRYGALAVAAGVLAVVLYRRLLRRAFAPLHDHSMALLLERRFGQFHDGLLTTVDSVENPQRAEQFNSEMLDHALRETAGQVDSVRLGSVFRFRPLFLSVVAALLATASVSAFALTCGDAFAVWSNRSLSFSQQLWPRNTRLVVDGFDGDTVKVARGEDFPLVVLADTSMVVPEKISIRYTTDDGATASVYMTKSGNAAASGAPYQRYTFKFERLHSSVSFDLKGGDARRGGLRTEVVDSPTLANVVLSCRFPSYIKSQGGSQQEDLPVSGTMDLPMGTHVMIKARSNKDLVRVVVKRLDGDETKLLETIELPDRKANTNSLRDFRFVIERLTEDTTLLLRLTDTDGITNRRPARLVLTARSDETPQVAVRLHGIGSAITPAARLPIVGKITDDYGLAKGWFEYRIDKSQPARQSFRLPKGGNLTPESQARLNVRGFDPKLTPGQTLHVVVKAADHFDVTGQPNVGAGEHYELPVISLDQLRVLLGTRELRLRKRFETIIYELNDTRKSLVKVRFTPPKESESDNNKTASETEPPLSAEELLARAIAAVERVVQNTERSKYETLDLAGAFDDIALELANNAVYDPDLQERLKLRIAAPLRGLGEKNFVTLAKQLADLQTDQDKTESQAAALVQLDAILSAMQGVLNEMKDVAQLSELLAGLRRLHDAQAALRTATEKIRGEKARSLLDDLNDLED